MLQPEEQYLTLQELEQDLLNTTGNPALAKAQAQQYAIMYKGNIINSVRYKRGLISKDEYVLSRHVLWEHNKYHSKKLSDNMLASNNSKRPDNTAAHHIVAWDDMRASQSRLRLAAFGIDIDSAANGVFLPRFSKHVPMKSMPNAYSHSTMHTKEYYLNVEFLLEETIAQGLGRKEIIETLQDIAEDLQAGEFPLHETYEA
ncbi:MAG: hypothetical protein GY787_28930 [Alteromonadales bacterium]|nr:hypothetical protein [Alteromonadales bacterium]